MNDRPRLAGILTLVLLLSSIAGVDRPSTAAEAHVSLLGDDGSADGTPEKPFRTIAEALRFLSEDPRPVVVVEPGIYPGGPEGDSFPIRIHRALDVTLRGSSAGEAVLRADGQEAVIAIEVQKGGRPTVRVEDLRIEGGLTGIAAGGEEDAEYELQVVRNRFAGQGYQGVEAVGAPRAKATVRIADNTLDGKAAFGIDIGAGKESTVEVEVTGNRIEGPSPPEGGPLPYEPLRFGASIYLEAGSRVKGVVERNSFRQVPVGIMVLGSNLAGEAGVIDLRIRDCLIAGDAELSRTRLRHGVFLGSSPLAGTIAISRSTVAHGSGRAIHEEPASGEPLGLQLSLTDSIVWGMAGGAFEAPEEGPLPPRYSVVQGNILPPDTFLPDGNRSVDPLLGPDLVPGAGSPAIDAGGDIGTGDEPPGDARGACRVADGDGDGVYRVDLGALEREGPCRREALPFRRGDCNMSRSIEITDAIWILGYLFRGDVEPACFDACDANDDARVNIADSIYTLAFLFQGGAAPPEPFLEPGFDPTPDGLGACR